MVSWVGRSVMSPARLWRPRGAGTRSRCCQSTNVRFADCTSSGAKRPSCSVTYDGDVPNIALPRPLPRPRGRRQTSPDEVMPDVIATPDIIEAAGLRWIHIESPRSADRDWLEDAFDFHPLDYEDVYSRTQRPKLDQYDDYVFIVLHFPLFDSDTARVLTAELDPFMGPGYLITPPTRALPPLPAR